MRSAIAGGFIAALIIAATQPAAARIHPRVAGLDCGALVHRVGSANVWRAFFSGERETVFDRRWPYTAAPCFLSQVDCINWLYWAQTDYPLNQEIRTCRRGIR